MNLTPIEILDLKRLMERLERESKDRIRDKTLNAVRFTDIAIESSRALPVLKKILEPIFFLENSRPEHQPITASEPVPGFVCGDQVTWSSQANGHSTCKTGRVVAVVPVNVSPNYVLPAGSLMKDKTFRRRNHESYLVRVGGRQMLYWPLVKYLKLSQ